jgi:hypothetical protein
MTRTNEPPAGGLVWTATAWGLERVEGARAELFRELRAKYGPVWVASQLTPDERARAFPDEDRPLTAEEQKSRDRWIAAPRAARVEALRRTARRRGAR